MNVILGYDGSSSADDAASLAASLRWPPGTHIVVANVAAGAEELATPPVALAGARVPVEMRVLRGRPATELARLAADSGADLLLLGSRGRGQLAAMLLGSVSAELVERAPCSVLVARGPRCDALLFGTDGSPASRLIPRVVCGWELFRGQRATVAGVIGGDVDERTAAFETRRFAVRLGTCGIVTEDEVLAGDPAVVLIDRARALGADLLVIGPRGRSRIRSVLLGGVARNVVHHAGCSVLVVRDRRRGASAPAPARTRSDAAP